MVLPLLSFFPEYLIMCSLVQLLCAFRKKSLRESNLNFTIICIHTIYYYIHIIETSWGVTPYIIDIMLFLPHVLYKNNIKEERG